MIDKTKIKDRLFEIFDVINHHESIKISYHNFAELSKAAYDRIDELERRLEIAEEVLKIYADEQTYELADLFDAETPPKNIFYDEFYYPVLEDKGNTAKQALKQIRGE